MRVSRIARSLVVVSLVAACTSEGGVTGAASDRGSNDTAPPSAQAPGGSAGPSAPQPSDEDGDGVPDDLDNCPMVPNPAQADAEICVWPNKLSRATSDPWLVANHARVRLLRPKLLVVNFANGVGEGGEDRLTPGSRFSADDLRHKVESFTDLLREASRPHGYADAGARPLWQPEIVRVVDMSDGSSHVNSARFPRGAALPDKPGMRLVGYSKLFERDYDFGFRDAGGRVLTLGEASALGMFHDVVMIANQVDGRSTIPPDQVTTNILEVAFAAQAYDAQLAPIPGEFVKNGVAFERQKLPVSPASLDDNTMPWTGRSMRVYFMNASRGAGCLAHSLGHEIEFRFNESRVYAPGKPYHGRNVMPSVQAAFREFAGFDYADRYGAPFRSLYEAGDDYAYDGCSTGGCATLRAGKTTISSYSTACGNVHYPPGAARGYDYYPRAAVPSTCEGFASGSRAPTRSDPNRWRKLPVDDDCGGRFLTYWMQNMPNVPPASGPPRHPNWLALMYL